jgi:hypothetical protein
MKTTTGKTMKETTKAPKRKKRTSDMDPMRIDEEEDWEDDEGEEDDEWDEEEEDQ